MLREVAILEGVEGKALGEVAPKISQSFLSRFEESLDIDKPRYLRGMDEIAMFWKRLDNEAMQSEVPQHEANDVSESKYLSTYEERINKTPTNRNTERGHWEGHRGESKYIPSENRTEVIPAKYGLDGIVYRDGIPDFSGCSEVTVEIDSMSEDRQGKGRNYEQADQRCAEQWNKEGRDGKTDWTARDAANWRRENGYSWHECNDRRTCQMIPTATNDYFLHFGGVGECKKMKAEEDGFDE